MCVKNKENKFTNNFLYSHYVFTYVFFDETCCYKVYKIWHIIIFEFFVKV